ncbi:MarR family winged helix-turn-helix transcriptional regulator [Caulobacter mirabilis]|uniref:MarR family winged helix-turn-helix transcriptional regulator n=1 Tax=Caulobacter mirabilis TaxID=69666 RepID=UPI0015589673|nr:MarR family transcriptional regulator [Caulobacter mirabilis]
MRRLIDRLDRDVQTLYREAGVRFEPRWYAVFVSLRDHGPATVGELAQRLDVTHAAVSQVRAALLSAGLIETRPDPRDGRRHTLVLSPEGEATAQRLQPLWDAINAATAGILASEAPGLLQGLDDLAAALDRQPLKTRVASLL